MNKQPPFIIEDYFSSHKNGLYKYTLRDSETKEAIAPLTSELGKKMKLLLQCWDIANSSESS